MEVKVLITGHFSAGKTRFVKTITNNSVSAEVDLTEGEEKKKKATTTVAMDYGNIEIAGRKVHLFGTPGQERFDFMLDILGKDMDGALILLDSTDKEAIEKTARFLDFLKKSGKPFILACNKQDIENRLSPEEIAKITGVPEDKVLPLVATDEKSCALVLEALLKDISSPKKAA
ncbi:MAG: GTP-binding protein [Aquificae bacterium]|nr:GTP-binding protein [Aquificota bacterium]